MKSVLRDKIQHNGRLADELKASDGYKQVQQKLAEKRESLLKEVLTETEISEVRHRAGFISGLNFMEDLIDQWSRRAKSIK